MKIAYLILAHNNLDHLQKLVAALQTEHSACFIHIDRKSDADEFLSVGGSQVIFTDQRIPVYWGDFSIVEATLLLIRQALADSRFFQRFVLLSGVDYPVRPVSEIEMFFRNNPKVEFINLVQMPAARERKPMWRLTTPRFPRPQDLFIKKQIRKLGVCIGVGRILRARAYEKHFRHLTPYAGDQWWALTRDACEYTLDFIEKEPGLYDFFKNTRCPDEMFFQIILGNSSFCERIQRNLTFADWGNNPALHPASISEKHLEDLFRVNLSFDPDGWYGAGPILFARKFSDEDAFLIDEIKRNIADRERRNNQNSLDM
jgi:hypothetical protein